MIDVEALHRFWTETDESLVTLARRFDASPASISRIIRHRREMEGDQRWPHRESPTRPPREVIRPRRGQSTLPLLASEQ